MKNNLQNISVAEVYVFKGKDYVGWDCFTKKKISVGSSKDADLVLDDLDIREIQALLYFDFEGDKIVVSDQTVGHGVRVNGLTVDTCILGQLDSISIGPYNLKIKLHVSKSFAQKGDDEQDRKREGEICENSENSEYVPGAGETTYIAHIDDIDDDDGDGEDKEDLEGLFSLKEKLFDYKEAEGRKNRGETLLKVVKYREDNVLDVRFLNKGEKYYTTRYRNRFLIAENKDSREYYFYFNNEEFSGQVRSRDAASIIDIANLCIQKNLYRKRKNIYRYAVPSKGDAIINDGYYEYLVRRVNRAGIPKIPDPPKKENNYLKNLIRSTVFHTIVLFLGGLFFSLSSPPGPQPPESRFVKIDTNQLINTKKKIEPVPKKLKPREVQKPTKKLKKKLKKSTYAKSTPKRKRRIVRSPKASKASGKAHGNVLNRNIKEAGILSALGINKGIRLGVKNALAAVTNLDAVTSLHSNEGKLKVGGIVGKLDSSGIEVPSVGFVNTMGSTEVLRSAGIEGNGKIAALEKGKTGQKQVKAMVTADLNKRVRVQGGMSREAVKKVIDQHIDELSYCYETALIADPSLMGKMVFEWKILLTGRVGEIRIKSASIKSHDIYSCIKAAIKSWQFPEPEGTGVVVSYPMIFDVVGF